VRKVTGTFKPHFAYDQNGQLLGEYNSSGGVLQEFVWLGGTLVAVLSNSTTAEPRVYYAYSDHLNAPQVIVNAAGDVRWRWISEPFGTTAAESIPNSLENLVVNLRFSGQYFDKESGLSYNCFRDYDGTTGRYVQSDPIGLEGGINTFSYALNQPTRYTDALGLFAGDGHSNMTREALSGDSCIDVEKLARETQDADYAPGSQAPANAHWHAMSDGKTGESAESARAKYEKFVDESLAQCTLPALARALHAVQDSAADGHKGFQPWSGGLPSRSHAKADFFPSKESWAEGVQKTKDLIGRHKEKCGCCK